MIPERMMRLDRAARAASRLAGALSIVIGTLVLLEWMFDFFSFRYLIPGAVSMVPISALCFVLLGAATLAASTPASARRARLARLGAMSAAAFGALTLVQYVLGFGFDFDRLWLVPAGAAGGLSPGRMAPDTAICFVLMASSLWLKTSPRKSEARSVSGVILSMLAAAGGLTVLLVTSIRGGVGWFGLGSMAASTAGLFAVLGLTAAASQISEDAVRWEFDVWAAAALVAGLVIVTSVGLYANGSLGQIAALERQAQFREQILRATTRIISDEGSAIAYAHDYMITGDARRLKAYLTARTGCAVELTALRRLSDDDPQGRHRTAALEMKLTAMLDWWRQALAAHPSGRLTLDAVRAVNAHDQESTAAFAAMLARVEDEELETSLARSRESDRLARTSRLIAGAGTVGGIAVLIAGIILLNRSMLKKKRVDEALRQNEEKYRKLFQSEGDAVVFLDTGTREIEDVNAAALTLYGYTKEEFLKLRVEDISAEPERTRRGVEQSHAGTSPGMIASIGHKKKGGVVFPAEISTSVFLFNERRKAIAIIRDLTESRLREEQLRVSESRLRSLFENNRDALLVIAYPAMSFSACNPAAAAMFRAKDTADFLSHTPAELSPESQPDGSSSLKKKREFVEAALREGSQHFEWTHRRLDGEEFPADVLLTKAESGGRTFVQATIRDVTEVHRVTAERRLLATAIEQASESVIITDAEARILYVNPVFERVTGYSRAEALGNKPSLIKSGRHERAFYEEMWATLARGETWRGHLFNRRKNGEIFEEDASITPVRVGDGVVTHYIAVKRDIAKERALEAQFFQSQKMEAVGRLAGGIAHDFNNILTAIIGSAQLLAPAVAAGSQAAKDVATIVDSGIRAATLTRQLLTFSRRQTVENATFDLNASVGNIQPMLSRTLSADVRFAVQLSERPVWINADAGQIDQVLLNLVINARDAMPRGGNLTLSTGVQEFSGSRVSADDSAPAGVYALLRCADTGEGMSDSVLARLFEPFFTTKEKGTGLGLSTVYGIVKESGGHIFVDSAPGRGATFDILFPLAAPPAAKKGAVPDDSRAACSETILLVEDEEPVLQMVQRTLKSQGYTVLTSRSAEEALEVSAGHRGRVDLLLTDVVMSGMSGYDLARRTIARRPGTRVLYMSGFPDVPLETGESPASPRDILQKPFQLAELIARVRRALDAGGISPNSR